MNQHDFVRGCLEFYEEAGMTPEKGWEEAHYPAPKGQGTETIWLTHDHHQIQGLLQSEEYGCVCFFPGNVKKFLTQGWFVSNWFELWRLYEKWAKQGGENVRDNQLGMFNPTAQEKLKVVQKDAGQRVKRMKVGIFNLDYKEKILENARENGRKTSLPVTCLDTSSEYPSAREAMRKTGINSTSIIRCCRNTYKKAGGLRWQFSVTDPNV